MKQEEDKYTRDLPLKRRGRPADPNPPTEEERKRMVAERKRLQRQRLAEQGKVARTYNLSADVVAALDKFVQFKDEDKDAVVERILRDRLMRKR